MNTTDARKLNQQAQYELRKQVVRLREKGMSNKAISEIVGLSEWHISTIWKNFKEVASMPSSQVFAVVGMESSVN